MLELKKMMVQSLYTWRVAWSSLPISNFSEFLEFCSSFFYILGVFLYTLCVIELRSYAFLLNLHYLLKRKVAF
jgi:hypothetical protein